MSSCHQCNVARHFSRAPCDVTLHCTASCDGARMISGATVHGESSCKRCMAKRHDGTRRACTTSCSAGHCRATLHGGSSCDVVWAWSSFGVAWHRADAVHGISSCDIVRRGHRAALCCTASCRCGARRIIVWRCTGGCWSPCDVAAQHRATALDSRSNRYPYGIIGSLLLVDDRERGARRRVQTFCTALLCCGRARLVIMLMRRCLPLRFWRESQSKDLLTAGSFEKKSLEISFYWIM